MAYPDLEIELYPEEVKPPPEPEPTLIVASPVAPGPVVPKARDYMFNPTHESYRPERTKWYAVKAVEGQTIGDVQPVPDYLEHKQMHDLLGSLTKSGLHAPCIDLDFPVQLRPSSAPGHFHLFLQTEIPWEDYLKLLTVMEEIGLVQKGVLEVAKQRKQTVVFEPGKKQELMNHGIIPRTSNSNGVPPPAPAPVTTPYNPAPGLFRAPTPLPYLSTSRRPVRTTPNFNPIHIPDEQTF